jgi:hypothetical protein
MFDRSCLKCSGVAGAAIIMVAVATSSLTAQGVKLVPDIGVYVPTQDLIDVANGGQLQQQISLSIGGKLDIWFSKRIGIQGTGSYAPSQLTFNTSGPSIQEDANIFLGSGRLMIYLIPPTSPVSFMINGGVGLVNRSGAAYAELDDKTDLSGTFGAALGIRVGSFLSLKFSGESYIYNPDFLNSAVEEVSNLQNDLNLSVGFGIPLMGLGAGT